MTKQITIGIIGLGYWGPNLVRNFWLQPSAQVKYVCDLDEERLAGVRRQYPTIKTTTNAADIFADAGVTAVAIATPVATHFPLAKAALAAGKHVFLEKPMATSAAECEELIALAETRGLILTVDHTFLYTGAVRKMKELIDVGELGKLHYFDSERINLGLLQADVNVIWDLAPHDISIMNYLLANSQPTSVLAVGSKYVGNGAAEMAHITVNFASGQVGHIHVSWLSPVKIRKILLGGSKKMVLYDDIEPSEKIKVYDKGVEVDFSEVTAFKPLYRSGDVHIPKLDNTEALLLATQDFIEAIGKERPPAVSGRDGLVVVKILAACDQSLAAGSAVTV